MNSRKDLPKIIKKEFIESENISVLGARVHNLKNIDVSIPRNKLTVITGLSGSGKSSLAFDTIYAEGQRRYIETFNAYLNGEVYGYVVDDYEDSCWGYYSVEDAIGEAKSIVDWKIEEEKKQHFKQLKTWIKNKVPLHIRTAMRQVIMA